MQDQDTATLRVYTHVLRAHSDMVNMYSRRWRNPLGLYGNCCLHSRNMHAHKYTSIDALSDTETLTAYSRLPKTWNISRSSFSLRFRVEGRSCSISGSQVKRVLPTAPSSFMLCANVPNMWFTSSLFRPMYWARIKSHFGSTWVPPRSAFANI